jgi:hypothetical protein
VNLSHNDSFADHLSEWEFMGLPANCVVCGNATHTYDELNTCLAALPPHPTRAAPREASVSPGAAHSERADNAPGRVAM